MRVHITYTGGTIGMVDSPNGLTPGADLQGWLHNLLAGTELASSFSVSELNPLIDSSNATPESWQAIVDDLHANAASPNAADAYVILHGTDTMSYTSAALSYALNDFPAPVVVTGSQYPLGVVGSDAAPNVTGALRAATSQKMRGVGLFFGHQLFAGNRVTKTSSWAFKGFTSPNSAPMAITGAPWQWAATTTPASGWEQAVAPYQRHDVVMLSLTPGITAARLRAMLTPTPEAVILRAYGVGNAPSDEPGFNEVIADLVAGGCPVLVASQCHQADVLLGHYEAGSGLAKAGAVGTGDMTLEAAYAKLVFLLSQGLSGPEISQWISRSIAGEIS